MAGLCVFAFNLLGISLFEERADKYGEVLRQFFAKRLDGRKTYYGVVSLNYDLLLENVVNSFTDYIVKIQGDIKFNKDLQPNDWSDTPLYKLHGCVSTGSVIPPTWAKGDSKAVKSIWKNAYSQIG